MALNELFECMTGPRLYRIFRFRDLPGRPYVGNSVEVFADRVVQTASAFTSVALYSSPLVFIYLYRNGYFSTENNYLFFNYSFIRIVSTFSIVFFSAFIIRGIGRSSNPDYTAFLKVLKTAKESDVSSRLTLSRFDFDFKHWPIDFRWYDSKSLDHSKPPTLLSNSRQSRRSTILGNVRKLPCDILSYIVVHTFGRRMLYPGSVWILQKAVNNVLIDGRTKLIEEQRGERYKLLSRDGYEIDSLFVDRRIHKTNKSNTLVICSEGNAGFYEIGTMATPLEAGYSVLGWNHPGFAGSTGLPFPQNDINAIDVVIHFAVERLGFKLNDIILFGWSIGGFPTSWAAMQYPDIKGLILDASFDDVLPLAEAKMPQSWKPLVRNTIRTYFNLNISAHLNLYNGPVLFIRRIRDEIINTNDLQSLKTNRGNDLIIKLLSNRLPKLMEDEKVRSVLIEYLTHDVIHQTTLLNRYKVNNDLCLTQLVSYIESKSSNYPLLIGENNELSTESKIALILFLVQKQMKDYDSTHCTPLPSRLFLEPFNVFSYVTNKVNSNL